MPGPTNFAQLTTEQKTVWQKGLWKQARNLSFINQFAGSGPNAVVTRVGELSKSEKGARAVLTLLANLSGDGVVADNQLSSNEEEMKSYDTVIQIDQIRNANKSQGRMAEQRSVVMFREASQDVLAYWLADISDQLALQSLAGWNYSLQTNGAPRGSASQLTQLAFAGDVKPLTTNRWFRWSAASGLLAGDTSAIATGDKPTYEMLVELKAHARSTYMRGSLVNGGVETYHVFMHPKALAKLKLDDDFLANVRYAFMGQQGNNPLLNGSIVMADGLVIHEHRHVPNTLGAASGSKWGSGGAINGSTVLMVGAQALGMADLGAPTWEEEASDYQNRAGIAIGKIMGFLNPVLHNNFTGQPENFGVIRCDVAIQ